jgi:hypothetical protein
MNFNELKPIFDTKTFNILATLTNNPRCDLYLPNTTGIDENITYDPYDSSSVDATIITSSDPIFLANVRCIYTFNKQIVQENEIALGSDYKLILYIRADDLPPQAHDTTSALLIKFNNIMYKVHDHLNLYDILHEFTLG